MVVAGAYLVAHGTTQSGRRRPKRCQRVRPGTQSYPRRYIQVVAPLSRGVKIVLEVLAEMELRERLNLASLR